MIVFTLVMKFFPPLSYYSGSLFIQRAGFDALRAHGEGHTIRVLWEREDGALLVATAFFFVCASACPSTDRPALAL